MSTDHLTDSSEALPTQHLTMLPLTSPQQVSCVTQQVSCVTQQVSCVTCGRMAKPSTVNTPDIPLGLTQMQVDQVIQSIADLVGDRKPTPTMVIRIVARCLQCTKNLKLTSSLEKKLIIHTIQSYICHVDGLTQDDQDLLMTAVDTVVDDAVDTLTQFKYTKKCCVVA